MDIESIYKTIQVKCKICGQKARYIKSQLCAKHYLEEYNAKHK